MYNYLNETYNELDGYVLLMGVGYDKNTSLYLADARAEYPGKHLVKESRAVMVNGEREWGEGSYDKIRGNV